MIHRDARDICVWDVTLFMWHQIGWNKTVCEYLRWHHFHSQSNVTSLFNSLLLHSIHFIPDHNYDCDLKQTRTQSSFFGWGILFLKFMPPSFPWRTIIIIIKFSCEHGQEEREENEHSLFVGFLNDGDIALWSLSFQGVSMTQTEPAPDPLQCWRGTHMRAKFWHNFFEGNFICSLANKQHLLFSFLGHLFSQRLHLAGQSWW